MDEVVRIEPLQREQGLIAHECPSCRCVISVPVPPQDGGADSEPPLKLRRVRGVTLEAGLEVGPRKMQCSPGTNSSCRWLLG